MAKDIIDGYSLRHLLGTGQHSQVWDVVEMTTSKHFAMKVLLPEHQRDQVLRQGLIREGEVGKKLDHANLIKVYKVVKNPKNAYFLMEVFPAISLKQRITRRLDEPQEEEFLRQHALSILKQIATGLAYMNSSGWIHRDVKPDNILISDEGNVKLIDFAIAYQPPKGFFAKLFHKKGKRQGTLSYMSPEQIRGEILDSRSDIYSFGATAYELVTGRPPFRGSSMSDLLQKHLNEKPITPQAYNSDVTDDFANLLLRLLAKKKEDRPRNFHDILIQMRDLRVYKSRVAPPKSKPETKS